MKKKGDGGREIKDLICCATKEHILEICQASIGTVVVDNHGRERA